MTNLPLNQALRLINSTNQVLNEIMNALSGSKTEKYCTNHREVKKIQLRVEKIALVGVGVSHMVMVVDVYAEL